MIKCTNIQGFHRNSTALVFWKLGGTLDWSPANHRSHVYKYKPPLTFLQLQYKWLQWQMIAIPNQKKSQKLTFTFGQRLKQDKCLVPVAALLARRSSVEGVGRFWAEFRIGLLSQDLLQLLQVIDPVERLRCGSEVIDEMKNEALRSFCNDAQNWVILRGIVFLTHLLTITLGALFNED